MVEEDDGEGLEGHVEDGVGEGEVGTCCADDGLEEEHAQGAGEDFADELGEVDGFKVAGGDDGGGVGLLAEALGSSGQEDGMVCFWEEEKHYECYGCVEEGDPECPSPSDGW